MNWKDTSSYSRGDIEQLPTSWCAMIGRLRINVHRYIGYSKDQWLLTCAPFFDKQVLQSKDSDNAKIEALMMLGKEVGVISCALKAES